MLIACTSGGEASPGTVAPSQDPGPVRVTLDRVATLEQPLAIAIRAVDPALYVAEKTGRVMAIRDGRVLPRPVLDLRGDVSLGGEQGLLGLAFAPGRAIPLRQLHRRRRQHADRRVRGRGRPDAVVGVARGRCCSSTSPTPTTTAATSSSGPTATCTSGSATAAAAATRRATARTLGTLLGKMLRIDPRPSGGRSRTRVPPDNPFVGDAGARPEIWAYGLAQPVAVLLRPGDRRPVDRRRRAERVGGGRPAARRRARQAPTSAGTCSRARTGTLGTRRPARCRPSTSTRTRPAGAW